MKNIYYNEKPKMYDQELEEENIFIKGFLLGFFLNFFGVYLNKILYNKNEIRKDGVIFGLKASILFLLMIMIFFNLILLKKNYVQNKKFKQKYGKLLFVKEKNKYMSIKNLKKYNRKLKSNKNKSRNKNRGKNKHHKIHNHHRRHRKHQHSKD